MKNPFRYFNSSPEVIRVTVMMYIRYPLSLRQVEDLLFERSIDICHETVRFWWNRFGPFATHPKEGEKRDPAAKGYPAIDLSPPSFPCVGREDSQGREDCRGRPDRCVVGGLDEGIEGVAERARQQHPGPREPPAQELAREKAEDEAKDQVAGQMDRVGMKAEGRHGAPPLALPDQAGVAHARPPPVEGEGLVLLQDVNEQYGHAI